ncbi:basic leucine zipper and W2 domain-containing protein 1 isoform X2 [Lingula anatina]|uniref:Basic leucine zipper and W2 domain-containing protein 1 isoform X2 n=1 Tax=Lingula anatina TaxID=7574 RepID=A0A1S3I018_LINAN|nr:basic leucine zipper and W2 domain-containing protein 1 isoform X2 [Lingula anatina]|eukprot:XP_013391605.1 basic leucine zipper and W2 domain-containing protein 1 isoform X2 [Lingula anatina]
MSQKVEKPTLSGQKIKTRKRDEKEKYDPSGFRDTVVQGLNEAGNLELVSKYLDSAGSKLNYRGYADALFDILFAGGLLAPGGSIIKDAKPGKESCSNICVFAAEDTVESLKGFHEVFVKLIRRYKYLEKSFDEELRKLLLFLRGFSELERKKIAMMIGLCISSNLAGAQCLSNLFDEHLVKDGLALEFATVLFATVLQERDMAHLSGALKKAGLDSRLLELIPINKRTSENFAAHFMDAGLKQVVEFQKVQQSTNMKKELLKALDTMIKDEEPVKELIVLVQEQMKKHAITEQEAVVLVWSRIMNSVEWNKKEEVVADQALKHLKHYTSLLAALTKSGKSQMALLNKVQDYCYANMAFMKVFQKIVFLFYKMDVLSEDVILKWYEDPAATTKGKSIFLEQMKKFVEWLKNAEEESDDEEEEDEEEK